MSVETINKLNSLVFEKFGFKLADKQNIISLPFEKLVDFIMILRDEARFIGLEEQPYAQQVSMVLNKYVYPLISNSYKEEWKRLWETIASKEDNDPLPRQKIIQTALQTKNTAKNIVFVVEQKPQPKDF